MDSKPVAAGGPEGELPTEPASAQLQVSLHNLAAADAAAAHALALAADTAEALAAATPASGDALTALATEYARTVHTLGALLHDEVDKAGGPVAVAVAAVAHGGVLPSAAPAPAAAAAAADPA